MKNPSEIVLNYQRSNALAFNHADRSPLSGAFNSSLAMVFGKGNKKDVKWKGNDLNTPRVDLEPSDTKIGSPPLSLSQKEAEKKRYITLLFPVILKFAKRRRITNARSKHIGWINTRSTIPWAMAAHTSLSKRSVLLQKISLNIERISDIPYNLSRRIRCNGEEASIAVGGSFQSAPLAQEGNGKRNLLVSLLSNKIEEDFIKMIGKIPLRKPNKQPKERAIT
jgi:Protein of unknown function (DUF1639)